jgi:hypothetical protein
MQNWSHARGLTAGALLALAMTAVTPAQADVGTVPNGHGIYTFRCSDNEQLRIMFNGERRRAVVDRIRRSDVVLEQADAQSGFRFTRGDRYELSGDLEQIRWRVGNAEPLVCHRGER